MSIAKGRVPGTWKIWINLPTGGGKRRRLVRVITGTKKEAERVERDLKNSLDDGDYVARNKSTLGAFLRSWLEEKEPTVKYKTIKSYKEHLHHAFDSDLSNLQLQKLTPEHIGVLVSELHKSGASPGTIKNFRDVMRNALNRAVKTNKIKRNPVIDTVIPKITRMDPDIWTREEVIDFLEYIRSERIPISERCYADAFELILYTGLRRGEICGLRWSAVDLEKGLLMVAKTRHSKNGGGYYEDTPKSNAGRRIIELSEACVTFLEKIKGGQILARSEFEAIWPDDPWVICLPDGQLFRPETLTATFHRIIKRAGFAPTTVHKLRHAHATMLNEIGFGYADMAQRLGHSSVQLTMQTYIHIRGGVNSDKMQKLDGMLG